ncbi:PIN-like domain-containing protein [Paracoccus sp. R86501]|uniref:PIN-like domain-containing protein n=1 Tax=Paracoccus sp. R86501 TaxID=3101711 RepID=UPI003670C813
MIIPRDPFDRKAQDDALSNALLEPKHTAIYLDTSSLIWMYRLAYGARAEFMDWATAGVLNGKVHVPAWSLHELHKHRRSTDKLFPARPKVSAIESELRFLTEAASLFVDDDLATAKAFVGRAGYIDFLEEAKNNLIRALKVLRDVDVSKVEDHILPFFEKAALQSPLPDFADLASEFAARGESRIPPGYKDSRKKGDNGNEGGDGANRFGDLALWKEVLHHAEASTDIKKVIVITHDGKEDWVFSPNRFIDYNGNIQPNNSKPKVVTCPHPTLYSEARTVAGLDELYIITIPQLIQLISNRGVAKDVQQLARAVQIEQEAADAEIDNSGESSDGLSVANDSSDQVDVLGEGSAQADGPAIAHDSDIDNPAQEPTAESEADEVLAALKDMPTSALADAEYKFLKSENEADTVIRELKSHNWYRQNPAIGRVEAILLDHDASYEQIFVIARNVYQAACGNSNAAVHLMENLEAFLSRIPSPTKEVLFSGLIFEAYFDSNGDIRHEVKGDYLTPLFECSQIPELKSAVVWFRNYIKPYQGSYLKLPGDLNDLEIFQIEENEDFVLQINVRGINIVERISEDFSFDALPNAASERLLRNEISSHFALPPSLIRFDSSWEGAKDLSHLKFITWEPSKDFAFPA